MLYAYFLIVCLQALTAAKIITNAIKGATSETQEREVFVACPIVIEAENRRQYTTVCF